MSPFSCPLCGTGGATVRRRPIFWNRVVRVLTEDAVRADVASLLHVRPDELRDADNLFEFGLDSIRVATLVERWREGGAEVSFVQLAEVPTLGEWLRVLVPAGDPLANA